MTLFFMACLANGPNLSRCSLVICILSSEKGLSRFNCTLFVLSRFVFLIGDFLSFILAEFLAFGGLMDTAARRPFLNTFNFFCARSGPGVQQQTTLRPCDRLLYVEVFNFNYRMLAGS
jgi:hypothetical protein